MLSGRFPIRLFFVMSSAAVLSPAACSSFSEAEVQADASDGGDAGNETDGADATNVPDALPLADGPVLPTFPMTFHLDTTADCADWGSQASATFAQIADGFAGGACRICGVGAVDAPPFVFHTLPVAVGDYTINARLRSAKAMTAASAGIGFQLSSTQEPFKSQPGTGSSSTALEPAWTAAASRTIRVDSLVAADGSPAVLHATIEMDQASDGMSHCADVDEVVVDFTP